MESLTPYECICLAKLLSVALGVAGQEQMAADEVDIAYEVLKHMAAQSPGWTQEQKDVYRLLVDCTKIGMGRQSVRGAAPKMMPQRRGRARL